jgi:hypothetical protein
MENTMKEFMEDTELQELAVDETSEVTYAVWAIGYDSDSKVTDTDMLLCEFTDPDQAVAKAKTVTLADIVHQAAEEDDGSEPSEDIAYISVEVETVVNTEDGTMNVGTIFKRVLPICDESEEDEYSEVVPVTANDYKLLDDGSIEISCGILKDFNKNDQVQIWFTDEDNTPILTYRIISKTTANTFICEFVY